MERMGTWIRPVVGAALLWSWGFICYLSPAMFPYASAQGSVGIEFAYFVSQLCAALFAVVVYLVLQRHQMPVGPHWFLVAAVVLSLTVVADELVLLGMLPFGVFYVCGALDGVAVSLLGVAWGARFSLGDKHGQVRAGSLVLLSFLVAYAIYLQVSLLPYPVGVVVTFLVPLGSWGIWLYDARARHAVGGDVLPVSSGAEDAGFPGEVSAGERSVNFLPWKSLSLIAFAALMANLVCSYVMGWRYDAVGMVSGGVLVVAAITTMTYVMSLRQGGVSVEGVYWFSLPFAVLGMLAMLVFGQDGFIVGGSLLNGCGMFMQSLIVFKVLESVQQKGVSPLLGFSVGLGLVALMVFVGNVAGKLLLGAFGFSELLLGVLCAIGVLTLFLMLIAQVRGDEPAREPAPEVPDTGASINPSDDKDERLRRMEKAYDLTARECEVFELLARGRSLPVIADQLFVTTGTVKTHTMHIYRKLEVNSKQELLDLVESDL